MSQLITIKSIILHLCRKICDWIWGHLNLHSVWCSPNYFDAREAFHAAQIRDIKLIKRDKRITHQAW